MKLYKLTNKHGQTMGKTQWGEGIQHSVAWRQRKPWLCTSSVIHAYRTIELALLFNSVHANIRNPRLWESEGDVAVEDWSKVGCVSLTTTKELQLPEWYTDQATRKRVQVVFSALCAAAVLPIFEEAYPKDMQPRNAIQAALNVIAGHTEPFTASAAADAAARSAVYAADATSRVRLRAANAAANAAYTAWSAAADTGGHAASAATSAWSAANSAVSAADAVCSKQIDFAKLAREAAEVGSLEDETL